MAGSTAIAGNTHQERTVIQRHIDTTDKRIDALAYQLYGVTEKEITIGEEDQRQFT